jgi:putative SOS response-associated peptidase YedK
MCNLYSITTNQATIIALFRVMNRYVGNLPPLPGVFPDYPAPVVRNAAAERELIMMRWGMPPPPKFGGPPVTNICNTASPHWRGWLKPPMPRTGAQFFRIRARGQSCDRQRTYNGAKRDR